MKKLLLGLSLMLAVLLFFSFGATAQETCTVYVINASQYTADIWIHSEEYNSTQNLGRLEGNLHMDVSGPCTTGFLDIAAFSADPNAPEQFFEVSFMDSNGIHPHAFVILKNESRAQQPQWNGISQL